MVTNSCSTYIFGLKYWYGIGSRKYSIAAALVVVVICLHWFIFLVQKYVRSWIIGIIDPFTLGCVWSLKRRHKTCCDSSHTLILAPENSLLVAIQSWIMQGPQRTTVGRELEMLSARVSSDGGLQACAVIDKFAIKQAVGGRPRPMWAVVTCTGCTLVFVCLQGSSLNEIWPLARLRKGRWFIEARLLHPWWAQTIPSHKLSEFRPCMDRWLAVQRALCVRNRRHDCY